MRYVVSFAIVVILCLAFERAGWHLRPTLMDCWGHLARGSLALAIALLVVRCVEMVAKGVRNAAG